MYQPPRPAQPGHPSAGRQNEYYSTCGAHRARRRSEKIFEVFWSEWCIFSHIRKRESLSVASWTTCAILFDHCQGRNGKFCVTVGPVPGLLTYWPSPLSGRLGLYASLIGFNPRRLKVLKRGWAPTQLSMQNLLLLLTSIYLSKHVDGKADTSSVVDDHWSL